MKLGVGIMLLGVGGSGCRVVVCDGIGWYFFLVDKKLKSHRIIIIIIIIVAIVVIFLSQLQNRFEDGHEDTKNETWT